jgi:uncharacterized protein DUF2795
VEPTSHEHEAETRALLAATFPPSQFPATRDELVRAAEDASADDELLAELHGLPPGPYDDVDELGDQMRAIDLASEVAAENPDPTTRREAIEQALDAEDLSEEGEELGQHID